MNDADRAVLCSIINSISDALTRTHPMTKMGAIRETANLSQDYHEQTRVYAYLHKRDQKF